jgi:hypothetical protein
VSNVKRVIRLEADADKLEADASELRWQAAELITQDLDTGDWTVQAYADAIGKSQAHVSYMRAVWQRYGQDHHHGDDLGFDHYYQLGKRPDDRPPTGKLPPDLARCRETYQRLVKAQMELAKLLTPASRVFQIIMAEAEADYAEAQAERLRAEAERLRAEAE